MKIKKFPYKKELGYALFMFGFVALTFLSLYAFLLMGYALGMPM